MGMGDGVHRGVTVAARAIASAGWRAGAASRAGAAVLLALALVGCGTPVVNPVSGRTERSVMDEATEVAEGRKAHQQVLQEYGVLANPALQAYVDEVGQKLARQSHRSQLQWTFTVLDSPEINAFALPGGFIYITRGLMAYLDSEADLAGVLGHEIGHVTARHGAQRATRQQNAGLGVLAATVLGVVLEGAGVGGAAQAASQISQGVAAGRLAAYSREQETQADQLGAEYLARTRYNPRNMIDVIRVLKAQERFAADQARAEGRAAPSGTDWLASHPSNDQRLADITRVAAGYAGSYGDDNRARYLKAIDGLTFGESRQQGVTRGRQFFHEDLGVTLTAPVGWRIQNTPEAVAVVNGAADAGVVIRLVPASAGRTHEEILRNLVQAADGRVDRRQVNGLPLTAFAGNRRTAQGGLQPVRVSLITGPGERHYLLLHQARDAAAAARAAGGIQETENSFRAMTAADTAAARPYTLRVVAMPRGGFAELARGAADPARMEAQLRLLNGVYLVEGGAGQADPAAGSPVKVPR